MKKGNENMKFYFEGRLIRTSKNHHYTHALINIQTERRSPVPQKARRPARATSKPV